MSGGRSHESHFHLVKDPTAETDPRCVAIKEPHGGFLTCVFPLVWGGGELDGRHSTAALSPPPSAIPHTGSFDAHGHLAIAKGLSETETPAALPWFLMEVRLVCVSFGVRGPRRGSHVLLQFVHRYGRRRARPRTRSSTTATTTTTKATGGIGGKGGPLLLPLP